MQCKEILAFDYYIIIIFICQAFWEIFNKIQKQNISAGIIYVQVISRSCHEYDITNKDKNISKISKIIFSLKMKKTLVFSEKIGYNIL